MLVQQAASNCVYRIYTLELPVHRDQCIRVEGDVQVSHSIDRVCWSGFVDLRSWNKPYGDFFVRFRSSKGIKVWVDDVEVAYTSCLEPTSFLSEACNISSIYDGFDCALLLQQQLADNIICMLGIPVYYFRVEPKEDSADYTFKEYTLHNVTDMKQLKIMVEDGQLPSSNHKLSQFDFDWEQDWVVEVSKTHFARAFGDAAFPKSRDFLWVPMLQRMYEVNSAYDERNEGLLYRSTTFKLALAKYQDSDNVEGFDETINSLIDSYDEVFGIEDVEQSRESGIDQLTISKAHNTSNITKTQDYFRTYIDARIDNVHTCHKSNIMGRNMYKDINSIVYKNSFCGPDGTISFIIETKKSDIHTIMSFGSVEFGWFNGIAVGDVLVDMKEGTYMVIYRFSASMGVSELYIYEHRGPDKPKYLIRPESMFFEQVSFDSRPYIEVVKGKCEVYKTPHHITNIKVYNSWVELDELFKYSTNHQNCIINDLARPLNEGLGYSVK